MYILDLETKPQSDLVDLFNSKITAPANYKKQESIDAYIEEKKKESVKGMSVDSDYADIFCIGVKKLGGSAAVLGPEEIENVFKEIGDNVIITANGKGFDIPLIIKYGIKNNLDLPYKRLKMAMRKYSTEGHIDLLEQLGDGKYKSLDEYLQIYLGISKTEIDFATCTDEELRGHCLEDLMNTEELFNKFSPLFV